MKNKKGFIATSLMYSFFIVFALLALTILATYSHYRYLNNDLNMSILEELNHKISSKYARLYNFVEDGSFEDDSFNWSEYSSSISNSYSSKICNMNDLKNKLLESNPYFTGYGSNYYFYGEEPYNYAKYEYSSTKYRIVSINSSINLVPDNQDYYNSEYYWNNTSSHPTSVSSISSNYLIDGGRGTYNDPYILKQAYGNICPNSESPGYTIYSAVSSFTGNKSMFMDTSVYNDPSFEQSFNTSKLSNKYSRHKIYVRFRVTKKNSIISDDSDVILSTNSGTFAYSNSYSNYLGYKYGVYPDNGGKVFLADGAPETKEYLPYNWELHSMIVNVNTYNTNNNWNIKFYINNINSQGGQIYVDDVIVTDVTTVYSDNMSGNSVYEDYQIKEYLDKNLNYFNDYYAIERYNS